MLFKKAVGGKRFILLIIVLLASVVMVQAIDLCFDKNNPLYCQPLSDETLCPDNLFDEQTYEYADECSLGCCCNDYLPDYIYKGLCEEGTQFYAAASTLDASTIDCAAMCSNQASFSLSGIITGEGTPIEDATVALVQGGNAISASDGSYAIEEVVSGIYTLHVIPPVDSGCQEKFIESLVVTGYGQVEDVDLTCDCVSNWDCEEFSACGEDNVQTRTCIDTNECPIPTNKPDFVQVCSYSDEAFCTDPNNLNNGEECYYDPANPSANTVGSCGVIDNCISVNDPNQQGCYCRNSFEYCGDGQCNAAIGECGSCVAAGEDCVDESNVLNPVCTTSCGDEVPILIEATSTPGDVNLHIFWNEHNPFCVDSYIIERCEGQDTNCQLFQDRNHHVTSFEDAELVQGMEYCYTVTFDYLDPLLPVATSEQVCFTTGDLACVFQYYEDTFCHNNSVSDCDETTLLINQIEPCETRTCIYDGTSASCYDQTPCDVCNGVYGVFADPQLTIENFACGAHYEEYLGACYYDQTTTTVEAYDSCSMITTCYDYASQEACDADTCDLFSRQPHEGCVWESYVDELGLGVCTPVNISFEDCTLCEDHPLLEMCTVGLCNAYGSCYYNPSTELTGGVEKLGCVGTEQMACAFYDTEEDCVNGSTVMVDVQWDADNIKRIGGTHEVEQQSNDLLELGTCRWTGSACIKDANEMSDAGDDCYEYPYDTENLARCFADNTPPVTTLSLDDSSEELITFGKGDHFDLIYSVSDNAYHSESIETYFCIPYEEETGKIVFRKAQSQEQVPCYPNRTLEALKNNLFYGDIEEDEFETALVYYSVDLAKNLEVVAKEDIFIDAKAPEIENFDADVQPIFVSEDTYLSDIEIQFQTSELAFCNASLISLGTGQTVTGGIYAYDTEFLTAYNRVQPSVYILYIDCHDLYGNYADTVEETIYADGDPSIRNPRPEGTLARSTVTLSIETGGATSCKYSEYPPFDYASMSTDNYFDQSTVDLNKFEKTLELPTGAYRFYTACVFPDGTVTEYNLADAIVFAIDDQAPRTDLVNADTGHHFLGGNHTEEIRLAAECYDPPITLGEVSMEFGCNRTEYCVARTNAGCTLWDVFDGIVDLSYLDADPETHLAWVYFNSTDDGGNAEEVQVVAVPLKDMRKPSVQVRIE